MADQKSKTPSILTSAPGLGSVSFAGATASSVSNTNSKVKDDSTKTAAGVVKAELPDPAVFAARAKARADEPDVKLPPELQFKGVGMGNTVGLNQELAGVASASDASKAKASAQLAEMDRRDALIREYTSGKKGTDLLHMPPATTSISLRSLNVKINGRRINPPNHKFVVTVRTNVSRGIPNTERPTDMIIGYAKDKKGAKAIRNAYIASPDTSNGDPEIYSVLNWTWHAATEERRKNPALRAEKSKRLRQRHRDWMVARLRQLEKEKTRHEIEDTLTSSHPYSMVGDVWATERKAIEAREQEKEDETPDLSSLPVHLRPANVTGVEETKSDPTSVTSVDDAMVKGGGAIDPDEDDSEDEGFEVPDWSYPTHLRLTGQSIAIVGMTRDTDPTDKSLVDDDIAKGKEPLQLYGPVFGDTDSEKEKCAKYHRALSNAYRDVEFFTVGLYVPGHVDVVDASTLQAEHHADEELGTLAQGLRTAGEDDADIEAMEEMLGQTTADVMTEPLQGMSALYKR